jgi:RHS repeat-associated protein
VLNRYKAVLNETKVALKDAPGGGGTTVEDSNKNLYRFNGQEWQNELGLDMTAMDFRQYDNALGRFVCIDMITHFNQTPYQFGNGNPMYWADPSGLDEMTSFGNAPNSLSNNPFAGGNAAVSNTGAWSGSSGGNLGTFAFGMGPAWGDGRILPQNGIQTFYGADAVSILRNFGSTWIPGQAGYGGDNEAVVFSGHWVQNSADKVGLAGIYGGTYLDMLDDYAQSNAGNIMKYGTAEFTAAELTLQNTSRMTQISKVASVSGRVLGGAGVLLSGFSMYSKYANNQTITTSEIVGATLGLSFLAGGIIAAGTAAAPFIGAAAIIYGSVQLISYTTTGKTVEQHIFND